MLIVICGATATGKSELALALAQRLNTVIISADSRQVYREFDIGTAKPSLSDRQQIPHYLIDCCEPTETFTLADYQQQAQRLVRSHRTPLLVGGTGLYIKAITRGLTIPRVAPQPNLRSQLASVDQSQRYGWLQQLDPAAAQKIHPHDGLRTLRSLEVYYVTGRPISEQQGENPPDYPILHLGLDGDRDTLQQYITRRTQHMIEAGFVAEVESLGQNYGWDLPLLHTLGYQEIRHYIWGDLSLEGAIAQTILHTRQFAKRQQTWFRPYPEIQWFDAAANNLIDQVWLCLKNALG